MSEKTETEFGLSTAERRTLDKTERSGSEIERANGEAFARELHAPQLRGWNMCTSTGHAPIRGASPGYHAASASKLVEPASTMCRVFGLGARSQTGFSKTAHSMRLALARAWQATLALRTDEALALLAAVERDTIELSALEVAQFRDNVGIVRAAILALQDDNVAALSLALTLGRKGQLIPAPDILTTICRLGYWKLGDHENACALRRRTPKLRQNKSKILPVVLDLSIDAAMEFEQLRFSTAKRLAYNALGLADKVLGRNSSASALAASLLAQVLYEEGYLDDADALIRHRLRTIATTGHIECVLRSHVTLARIASHRRQVEYAKILLQEAEDLGERRCWSRLIAASIAARLDLDLGLGRIADAEKHSKRLDRLAGRSDSGDGIARSEVQRYAAIGRCRVMLAQGASSNAIGALRQLQFEAASRKDFYLSIQITMLLVEALVATDEDATEMLLESLELGASTGLYQVFLGRGERFRFVLTHLYERRLPSGMGNVLILPYIGSLLEQYKMQDSSTDKSNAVPRSTGSLSGREREILRLISQGQSNKRIAQALEIAPETVKSHAKHIFVKLAVGTRAEAVSRAENLGLI